MTSKKEKELEFKISERRPKSMKLRDIKNTMVNDSPVSSRTRAPPKTITKLSASGTNISEWTTRKRVNPEGLASKSVAAPKSPPTQAPLPSLFTQPSVRDSVGPKSAKRRRPTMLLIEASELIDPEIPTPARSLHRAHSVVENSISAMMSPDELTNENHYVLKTVERPMTSHRAYGNISGETLSHLLSGMTEAQFRRQFLLLDCRYPYEYDGGHIRYAMNFFDPSLVETLFYPPSEEEFRRVSSKIPIFYCEFSQKRGPGMALELRKSDRARNEWPEIDYKQLYILDGGYSKFFSSDLKQFCEPEHYVTMHHSDYKEQLKTFEFHKSRAERTYSTHSLTNTTATMEDHSLTSLYVQPTPCSSVSVPVQVEMEQCQKLDSSTAASPPQPPKMSL